MKRYVRISEEQRLIGDIVRALRRSDYRAIQIAHAFVRALTGGGVSA